MDKSNEYQIRKDVIQQLLLEGWERDEIRIEIPLDTASSNGRADIVLLKPDFLGCIELKSGKDKLDSELLSKQCSPYRRAFDYCCVIADGSLRKIITTETEGNYGIRRLVDDNFKNVHIRYNYNPYALGDKKLCSFDNICHGDVCPVDKITDIVYPRNRRCALTTPYGMARILWASELKSILGGKTKYKNEIIVKEGWALKDWRPKVIEKLRTRVKNEWEIKFWKEFDDVGQDKKTDLEKMVDALNGET